MKVAEIDLAALLGELNAAGFLDEQKYIDIDVALGGQLSEYIQHSAHCKKSFFTEDDSLSGNTYKQLYMTGIKVGTEKSEIGNVESIFYRMKRLDPKRPQYLPVVDERNYGRIHDKCPPLLRQIIGAFKSPVAKVRLGLLKANCSIKPHVDYDPSYIVRYHIPLITNDKCTLSMKRNKAAETVVQHLPADGSVWFFNGGLLHWADNASDFDRYHLIIDTVGQDDLCKGLPCKS